MAHKFTRKELYDLVWSEPRKTLATRFGISDVAVAKSCRKHDIPMPERGYWARLKAGRNVSRPPLPPRGPGMDDDVVIGGRGYWDRSVPSDQEIIESTPEPPVFDRDLEEVIAEVRKKVGRVTVPKNLQKAHHLVRRLLEADEERKEKAARERYVMSWDKPQFESPFERRRLRILSAIFMALHRAGMKPSVRGREARELGVDVNSHDVSFWVDDVNAELVRSSEYYRPCRNPSGRMRIVIDSWRSDPGKRYIWEDTKAEKVEKFITDIVVELIVSGERRYREVAQHHYEWRVQCRDELIEEARLRREEEERQERELIARLKQERIDRLLADADALRRARDIRAYVREVKELYASGCVTVGKETLLEWEQWALAQADRIDPIISGRFRESMEDPAD